MAFNGQAVSAVYCSCTYYLPTRNESLSFARQNLTSGGKTRQFGEDFCAQKQRGRRTYLPAANEDRPEVTSFSLLYKPINPAIQDMYLLCHHPLPVHRIELRGFTAGKKTLFAH